MFIFKNYFKHSEYRDKTICEVMFLESKNNLDKYKFFIELTLGKIIFCVVSWMSSPWRTRDKHGI